MQRTILVWFAALTVALAGCAGLAYAQPEAAGEPLMGKVTLYDGRTFEGNIEFAEFGVVDADGIGSKLPDGGSLRLIVNGEEQTITAGEIKSVEAQWKNLGEEAKADWQIEQITVVKTDGSTVTGKPSWKLPASSLRIVTAEGEQPTRVHAFPLGRTFDEKNLIVKIELATEEAPTPAPPTPTPTPEAPKPPTTPPVVAPAPPKAAPPAAPPVPAAPTEGPKKPPTAPIVVPAAIPPPATGPVGPVRPPATGAPIPVSLTLTIVCPHCGKPITIDLAAYLRVGSAKPTK